VIDLARNATRVLQAGATTVPMTAQTLKLARLTGEGTPAWKTENAAITAADMTFDSVIFTARTLVRLVTLSVELFEDADNLQYAFLAYLRADVQLAQPAAFNVDTGVRAGASCWPRRPPPGSARSAAIRVMT
jgi:HK97 family phage major capsid protein